MKYSFIAFIVFLIYIEYFLSKKNLNKDFWEREKGRRETRERERENERREIEVGDSLESSIEGKGKQRTNWERRGLFFYLWMVGMPDVIHLF